MSRKGFKSRKTQWRSQHQDKIVHASRRAAQDHVDQLAEKSDTYPCQPYPCTWQDDYRFGQTAQLHWHVGRVSFVRGTRIRGTA